MNKCPYCSATFNDFKDLKFHVDLHAVVNEPRIPSTFTPSGGPLLAEGKRKSRLDELDKDPQN